MNISVLSVSQLNTYIKSIFDGDANLSNIFIEGEISNLKNHYSSGHLYFSLKDDKSLIRCVMFNRAASRLRFTPEDGMKLICVGKVSLYERDGSYQLYVEDMQPLGVGALAIAYEQLKKKLEREGLFDNESKRALPKFPNRIAVLTAETGAAIRDILSIAERRNPRVEIVICPVTVQGSNAAESMVNMLEKVYSAEGIDAIIIGRGGGSYEDLFCFNDEELVRKVYESPVPIISAVGHETDFTLCDFVADMRASTPSAAAELLIPDVRTASEDIKLLQSQLIRNINLIINKAFERFDRCTASELFISPEKFLLKKKVSFSTAFKDFTIASSKDFGEKYQRFALLLSKFEALNPASILKRGYSIVEKKGEIIKSAEKLEIGDKLDLKLSKGSAICTVNEILRSE